MTIDLSEEEIRHALFGDSARAVNGAPEVIPPKHSNKSSDRISSKIRVTMHVTNVFEGEYEVVVYNSTNLSALVAEMEAKKTYKKYRYVTVVSVERV